MGRCGNRAGVGWLYVRHDNRPNLNLLFKLKFNWFGCIIPAL